MITFGKDDLAKSYMALCIRMGEDMHLYGNERYRLEQFDGLSASGGSMLSYVSWGAFNASGYVHNVYSHAITRSRAEDARVYALHFHDLASGTFTKFPPLLPKPGSQLQIDGSSLLKQDETQPKHPGVSFPSFCQFWCIAHDMAAVYYSSPGPIHEHVPMAFAESKFRSLLKWADNLPPECRRQPEMSHNVTEIQ